MRRPGLVTTEDTTSEKCNEEVRPRWIDCHFPDYWLIRKYRHSRLGRATKHGRINRALARYSLRHVHCPSGECVLRAGHRGGCTWGYDEGDEDGRVTTTEDNKDQGAAEAIADALLAADVHADADDDAYYCSQVSQRILSALAEAGYTVVKTEAQREGGSADEQ